MSKEEQEFIDCDECGVLKHNKQEPKSVRIKSTGQVFPFRYAYYNEEHKCVLVVIDAGPENLGETDEFPMHYLEPIY